jgi:hypothetical protein
MTDTTYAVLQSVQNDILIDDRKRWRIAALNAYDAIYADIRCVVAGATQGVQNQYEDGMRRYVLRLLRPSIESLDQLNLAFARPSQEQDKIDAVIHEITDSDTSIAQKCNSYIEQFGFLPLGGKLSFSAFAEKLVTVSPSSGDAIKEMWIWARSVNDPLVTFHFSAALLEHPRWIAAAESAAMLDGIIQLFGVTPSQEDEVEKVEGEGSLQEQSQQERTQEGKGAFRFREELAQYYLRYLELTGPESIGEVLATWAWWLAHQTAKIFSASAVTLDRFRNVALIPQRQEIDVSWRLSHVKILPSRLSTATHWPASLWCLALTKRFNAQNLELLKSYGLSESMEQLAKALTPCVLFGDLPSTDRSTDAPYLFEGHLSDSVEAWLEVYGVSDRLQFWRQLTATYKELGDATQFMDKLRSAPESQVVDQIILSHGARRLSLEGRFQIDQVLEAMNNRAWRQQFFAKLDPAALEHIGSTIIWAAVESGDKWRFAIPHLLANVCEEVEADADRYVLLFSLLLCACMSSQSVSAIERLLRGKSRLKYLEAARKWSSTLADLNSTGPRWTGARGRAVHAAIGACLSGDSVMTPAVAEMDADKP